MQVDDKRAVTLDDTSINTFSFERTQTGVLRGRAVAQAPPAHSSLNVLRYYCSEVFSCKNAKNLAAATLITGATSLLIASTPFLFSKTFESGDIDFIGIELTRFQVVAGYTSALFLSKVLPILRRMVLHPVVGGTTFNTVYNYDVQDLGQPHSYHVKKSVGMKIDEILTTSIGSTELTSQLLYNILPSICEMGTAIGVLSANYGWEVGIWVGGVTAASLLFNVSTTGFIRRAFSEHKTARMNHTMQMGALWTNFESMYHFNTINYELGRVRELTDLARVSTTNNLQVPDRVSLINNVIAQAPLLGLILYSGQKMADGTYKVQDLSVILYFILQIGIPLNTLGESFNKFSASYLDLIPIINFIKNRPVTEQKPKLEIPNNSAGIVFNRVNFSYQDEPGKPILKDLSFSAKAGETVALVGMTAAGKSTIVRLLYRLYDSQDGDILINDQSIYEVDIDSLRNQLSIVPQNPVLFNNTIRYNIAYGAISILGDNISEDMIWDALEKAGLADEVRQFPDGLDTMVGQAGLRLSGGQLLRVAIARAIIRDAPIVFLDEYTSALDPETEAAVQKSLAIALKNKLKIVIAHRLSTIRNADKILVLDNGTVAEEGTFDELIEGNELFRRFWDKQQQLSVEEDQIETSDFPQAGWGGKKKAKLVLSEKTVSSKRYDYDKDDGSKLNEKTTLFLRKDGN